MENPFNFLNEYRCTCGRLLFKGLLLVGTVEVKCKKCGRITSFENTGNEFSFGDRYALISNKAGQIINASPNAYKVLGYSMPELLRMRIEDVIQGFSTDLVASINDRLWSIPDREAYSFRAELAHITKDKLRQNVTVVCKFLNTDPESMMGLFYLNDAFPGEIDEDKIFKGLREHNPVLTVRLDQEGRWVDIAHEPELYIGSSTTDLGSQSIIDLVAKSKEEKARVGAQLEAKQPFLLTNIDITFGSTKKQLRADILVIPTSGDDGAFEYYTAHFYSAGKRLAKAGGV
jgi:nitrogen-specific signal transduction histidine kinase